jgi:hypothetical protein
VDARRAQQGKTRIVSPSAPFCARNFTTFVAPRTSGDALVKELHARVNADVGAGMAAEPSIVGT